MSYRFIYCNADRSRVIPAVLIDKRAAVPAISGQVGSVIKAYTDSRVSEVNESRFLTYKIETGDGNLAGFWTLSVKRSGTAIVQYELRPAFEQFSSVISGLINTFISDGTWKQDSLV